MMARVLAMAALLVLANAGPAGAQSDDQRLATIDFEVGEYDAARGDWPVTIVTVSGDLEPDAIFVVELRGGDGDVVWAGEGVFNPPSTSVTVDSFVAVGDVDEAALGQMLAEGTTSTAVVAPVVADDVVTIPPTTSTAAPLDVPELSDQLAKPSPEVEGDVTTQDVEQLPQQGSGVGGAGQLALSMVIAVVFVAILFRAPLPAATTTRWRK